MNKKITKRLITLIIIALSTAVWAGIYKWVDEKGTIHFSDKPPLGEKVMVVEQKKNEVGPSQDYPQTPEDEHLLNEANSALNSQEYAKAMTLLKPLAERGNPRAQNGLGLIYGRGLGVPIDLNGGFKWHEKAAKQGYGPAQYYLGLMYADGNGVPKDAAEGAKWLRKAAEQGIPEAQFNLGEMYETGKGVDKLSSLAADWYRKAAKQGHAHAQHNLALMYASGEGVTRDLAQAFRWEQKAADQGDSFAQYGLGILYAKGEGVLQNYNEAFKWVRKAAEQGFPLGFDFESGWKIGHYAELPQHYSIIEFIREGDDINNWKELLTIQYFPPLCCGTSPEDTLNKLKAVREKECPGVTKWSVIEKDQNSILYEWQAKPCLGWSDQHEIARIIYGENNTFILHYALKTRQMPGDQRTKWINKLSKVK